MVKRIGTMRRRSRSKFSKSPRERGKVALRRFVSDFKAGDRVTLRAEPSVHKGMYLPRFHGITGTVVGSQGKSYFVEINDGGKKKTILVRPVHLKRL